MKKTLLFLLLSTAAWSQANNKPSIIPYPGAPSGVCSPAQLAVNTATGDLYDCAASSWNLIAGTSGSVTVSGSPSSGELTKFSGSDVITNGNLSGDVTTTNTLAATVVKVNGGSVPASAKVLGSNSSNQPIAAALSSAHLYVGSAGNLPVDVAVTGDVSLTNAGLTAVVSVSSGGLAGQAMCWKTNTTLSYCTTIVAADGTCTCH